MNLLSFVNLLNMSIKGSFVIAAVLVLRLIFMKRSAKERMPLWMLVGLRLLIPVSLLQSSMSIVPRQVTYLGETAVSAAIESAERGEAGTGGSDAGVIVFGVVLALWVLGVNLMIAYALISTYRLKRWLCESVMIRPGVWACDRIGTPLLFGFGNPQLYVPSSLSDEDLEYVISHEKEHIRRHDHWWKPVAFVVLTLHWFNPFVWAAYFAFGRDVELACDEAATCWRNYEERKAYANALINCSTEESIGVCPLAFGGSNVRGRVSAVLRNATPKILITIALCAAVLFGFCAEPADAIFRYDGLRGEIYGAVTSRFIEEEMDYTPEKKKWPYVDMRELGLEKDGDRVTVYLWVLYELYYYDDGDAVCAFSQRDAVRVTAEKIGDGEYEIVEYLVPQGEQIAEVFPLSVRSKVLYFDTLAEEQTSSCYYEAVLDLIPLYELDPEDRGVYIKEY